MIQGLGNNKLYSVYNRIQYPKQNEEALKNLNQNKQAEELKKTQQAAPVQAAPVMQMDLKLDSIRPRQNVSVEDISLSLNSPAPFEMKGKDSDIDSLDITKAVSDMQKDEALQQSTVFASEDGVVVAKPSFQ